MSWFLFISSLSCFLVVIVSLEPRGCNERRLEYLTCLQNVTSKDGITSEITGVNFQGFCASKLNAINCTKEYVSECLSTYQQSVLEMSVGGQMKLVEELCNKETHLNKAYSDNKECWNNTQKEVEFCSSKFQQSTKLIMDADMESDMKKFHQCCAFKWLKQCKVKIIGTKCNEEAVKYLETVTDRIFDITYKEVCHSITNQVFTNCYELYGVEVADLDDLFSSSNALQIPFVILFLLLMFTQLRFS